MKEISRCPKKTHVEKLAIALGAPLSEFRYAGGRENEHWSYFNIGPAKGREIPEKERYCKCGHWIKENCFVIHDFTKRLHVVGNCCIKKWISKSYRTCEICDSRHKNRFQNRCNKHSMKGKTLCHNITDFFSSRFE